MDAVLVSVEVTTPEGVSVTYTPQVGAPVPGPGLPEAPSDGSTYGRRNAAWVDVNAASLPAGGAISEVLTKLSETDGDAGWRSPYQTPFDGGTFN